MALNIYQRINAVMKEVSYVKKDAEVGFGQNKYKAVSHDAVIALVRKSCVDHGILIVTSQVGAGKVVPGETATGKPKIRYEAFYDVTFVNIDDPTDKFTASAEAHGDDGGDKGPGKTMSYASKMVILKTFMLETGIADESRYGDEQGGQGPQGKPPQAKQEDRQDNGASSRAQYAIISKKIAAFPPNKAQSVLNDYRKEIAEMPKEGQEGLTKLAREREASNQ